MGLATVAQAVVMLTLLSFLVFRWYGVAVSRRSLRRIRQHLVVGIAVAATVTVVVLAVLESDTVARETLLSVGVPPEIAGSLTWLPLAIGGWAVIVVAQVGAYPAVREVRGLDMSLLTATRRFAVEAGVLVLLMMFSVEVGLVLLADAGPLVTFVGALGVFVCVLLVAAPLVVWAIQSTRDPTDDERTLLEPKQWGADGLDYRVTVVEGTPQQSTYLEVLGQSRLRTLFVADFLFDRYDDEALDAMVTSATERAKRNFFETALGAVLGGVVLLIISFVFLDTSLLALGLLLLAFPVLFGGVRLARKRVYAADTAAAERTDPAVLAQALDELDEHKDTVEDGRVKRLVAVRPSPNDRAARLRERFPTH